MARRKRRKGVVKKIPQQVEARIKVSRIRKLSKSRGLTLRKDLKVLEDRRLWHPMENARDYRMLDGRNAEYITSTTRENEFRKVGQNYFKDPKQVVICKRRRQRREILFAIRKVGGKGPGRAKRKYTEESKVRCT